MRIMPFLGVSANAIPEPSRTLCMVSPWIKNGDLQTYVHSLHSTGHLTGYDLVVSIDTWLYQTAQGLAYLHQEDIVHGDLHEGNILVDDNGNVLLTDFGLSRIAEPICSLGPMQAGGSLHWIAPELFHPETFEISSTLWPTL